MASIISAGTTSGTSLNLSGDTSGVLQLASNGSTTAVTIDTSQRVGIGTSSPASQLEVKSPASTNSVVTINSTSTNVAQRINFSANGTIQAVLYNDASQTILNSATAIPLIFRTTDIERMRVNAGAPILCLAGGNTSATGTGIAFPASQSASSDANTLDDYEEGTFTPNQGLGVVTTGTFASSGTYTKIGRMVYVNFQMSATSIYVTSGGQITTNLPFTMPGNAMGVSASSNNAFSLAYCFGTEVYAGDGGITNNGAGALFITVTYIV